MTNDDIEIGLGILAILLMLGKKSGASQAAKSTAVQTYVAVPGDSLSKIAAKYWSSQYDSWLGGAMLAVANGISDANSVSVGQALKIPAVSSFTASQLQQAQNLADQAKAAYESNGSSTDYSVPDYTPADATMSNPDGTVS